MPVSSVIALGFLGTWIMAIAVVTVRSRRKRRRELAADTRKP